MILRFLESILLSQEIYSKALGGFLGFCYLALSQVIIQTDILVDVTSEWDSKLLFQATVEKHTFYLFQYDPESIIYSLMLSVAGTMHYYVSEKHSWIPIVPWIVSCTIHWITSSYICLKNALASFETDNFWMTLGLMILLISVKFLLLSEVVLHVGESVLKIITCSKELKSMVEGNEEDDIAQKESDGSVCESSLHRISDEI